MEKSDSAPEEQPLDPNLLWERFRQALAKSVSVTLPNGQSSMSFDLLTMLSEQRSLFLQVQVLQQMLAEIGAINPAVLQQRVVQMIAERTEQMMTPQLFVPVNGSPPPS